MAKITDELRAWAKTLTHWWYDPVKDEYTYTTGIMPPSIDAIRLDSNIIAIADRIDAEHEAKVSYWQGASYKDGYENGYDDGFASAGDWTEHGWVRLPVDADGVPIRVGDVMECDHGTVFTVEIISLYEFGWRCDGDGIDGNGYKCTAHPIPECCHHHRTPTVEDVLREMLCVWEDTLTSEGVDGIISEYAKKLRLAGDAE